MSLSLKKLNGNNLHVQLLRNASGSALIQGLGLLLTVLSGVLLARTLGPEGYGVYSFVLSIMLLLSLPIKAGLPTLLVREVAKNYLNKRWQLVRGLFLASNLLAVGYSVLICIGVLIWLSLQDKNGREDLEVFFWGAFLVPLLVLEAVRNGALRGLRFVVLAQVPEKIIRPLVMTLVVCGAILLSSDISVLTALQFNIFGAFLAFLFGTLFFKKALPVEVSEAPPQYEYKCWLTSLAPLSLFSGLKILDSEISILFLGSFSSSSDVGLYRVAATGATLVAFGLTAVNMALAPQIVRLYNSGDIDALQELVTMTTRIIALISFPVALTFIFFGDSILDLVFGEQYIPAATALAILCLGQLINASAGSVALVLNMTGNDRVTVYGAVVALIVNIVLAFILIPSFGLIGAAVSFSVSLAVWNILLMVMVKRIVGINTFFWFRG